MRLRRLAKASVAYIAYGSGLVDSLVARRTGISGQRSIMILGYHRVVESFETSSRVAIPSMLVSAKTFRRQLDLVRRKFECLSLDDALEAISGRRALQRDAIVLTFDDGYRDFYEVAFPILRAYGLPATLFVPTAFIGKETPLAHDQLYYLVMEMVRRNYSVVELLEKLNLTAPLLAIYRALYGREIDYFAAMRALFEMPLDEIATLIDAMREKLNFSVADFPAECRLLTWPMLRQIAAAGITIGAHTRNHALLTMETAKVAENEIYGSKADLEEKLGTRVNHFAYPDGRYNPRIIDLVWAAGFKSASTIDDRPNTLSENPYQLKRKILWERACMGIFSNYSEIVAECQLRGLFSNPAYKWHPTHIASGNQVTCHEQY